MPAVVPPASTATQPIALPPSITPTGKELDKPPLPPGQRLGIAVVGLGNLALTQIIPALGQTKYCKLAALVSSSPNKYENYDSI